MTRHTLDTSWPVGEDDVDVEIGFTFTPGYPGDRVDPPCPDEPEIAWAFITAADGSKTPCPATMLKAMSASDRIYQEMIEEAAEHNQPDPDDARDRTYNEAQS